MYQTPLLSDLKFKFPFKPYGVQEQYMHTLYDILKKGNIGIIESPTGTVSVTNFITI